MKFAICGAGRVGTSLTFSLKSVNWEFSGYYSKSYPDFIEETERIYSPAEFRGQDCLVILAVPDIAIEVLSSQLPPYLIVGHTSGSLDHKVIKAPNPKGRFSLHPLRSVPSHRLDLSGGYWGIEGDEVGLEVAEKIVGALKGKGLHIAPEKKPLYHMASIISTNLLTSLLFLAEQLFEKSGITDDVVTSLGEKVVNNVKDMDYLESLTGPVERGDWNTLDRDLKSLEENAHEFLVPVVKLLEINLKIAKKKGLKEEDANRIYSIISNYSES